MENENLYIGVDIGGTSIKLGIVNDEGEIKHKWGIPTNKENNGDSIVDDVWNSIEQQFTCLRWNVEELRGIGVGAPGFIDSKSGIVDEAVNIGWNHFDLAYRMKSASGLPVFIQNDANVAVLGENWKGAGEQEKNVIAITLGTGVGSGIISNGEVLSGVNGTAGEIGHMIVDPHGFPCNCGRKGCLETIASATGIVRQAKEAIAQKPNSQLAERCRRNNGITAKDVFELAHADDHIAENIVAYTAKVLGMELANIATIINPSKILLGGGVSQAGDILLNHVRKAFQTYALPRISDVCDINIAQLGNDAGIIGAAFLVKQELDNITF